MARNQGSLAEATNLSSNTRHDLNMFERFDQAAVKPGAKQAT
jgi:hypothetical protein